MICSYQVLHKQYDCLQVWHQWDQKIFLNKRDTWLFYRVCKHLFFDPLYLHYQFHCFKAWWCQEKKQVFWLLNPFLSHNLRHPTHIHNICCQKEDNLVVVPFTVNEVFRIMEITFISRNFLIFFQFQYLFSVWP